jgi:arabinan endo-1,5-alpha-L-arabinosidase
LISLRALFLRAIRRIPLRNFERGGFLGSWGLGFGESGVNSLKFGLWFGLILCCHAALSAYAGLAAPPLRGNLGAHDPGTIIKCKDRYYLFFTGTGISSKSSADRVYWTSGPNVFANAPAWTTNAVPGFTGVIWAPDIFYLNGRYCLYYAISTLGSQVSAIGLATNPTLDPTDATYNWTDQGIVIQSTNGSPYNTIDPCATKDASGNPWLCFGSYWNGIYVVQLDPLTGLRISTNSPTTRLAYNSSIEASCLFRRGGYYYLFADWGSCCSGVNSTYNVRLGRSTSITGPYLDRNGVDMANNGGTLFLQGTGKFTGPGHIGILSEGGTQWFSYHYYDAGAWAPWYNAYGIADFDFEPLSWTADDWPYFTNDWSAVYHFQADARDDNGQYYGMLLNGASIRTDPVYGHVLNLNGTNQYVRLPAGVAFGRTFTAVVKWNGGGAWQRVFDFGVDTTHYVMLTPSSGNGHLRCDIKAGGATQILETTSPLPVGVWTHVALTLSGSQGVLYVNGVPVATTNATTISPVDVLSQTNHLGHSKFVADPDFNGQIASFRAYGRVLSAAEIAAPQPSIAAPADGSVYYPGTSISFRGTAADFADVPLGTSSLSWRVDYAQDGKTYTVLGPPVGVTNGVLSIPTNATGGGTYRILLTATDTASRQRTVTATLFPANPPTSSSSYYPFRVDARDANGHYDATLNGGASIQSDPTRGNVLNLSGTSQFASLPAGAAGFQTFMAWVKWNGGAAWQRIYDFGNDTTHYTVLTPSAANGKLRCNITVNGIPGEQIIDAPGPLATGVWTHVAITLDGNVGVLYTNGVAIATNPAVNLVPQNLNPTNNYFGKSQFPDPYFSGQLSSVRLFSRALSAAEIVAPLPVINQPAQNSTYRPGDTIAFNGAASDFYDTSLAATSLTWTVQFRNSGTTNLVLGPLSGATNGSFLIPLTGANASNGFYHIQLAAVDSLGRKGTNSVDVFPISAAASSDWASFYPFTIDARDASNRFNGSLVGGASIQSDPARGNVLNLSGSGQYVSLPSGAGPACTFDAWVKWRGGGAWQRIFDLGYDTSHYFYLTPLTGSGIMQFALTAPGVGGDQVVAASSAFPTNVWTRVSVVVDGRQGILYWNGQPVAINNSVNLLPSDVTPQHNYFGHSQFPADPAFNGQMDSIRLNSRALALPDIIAPVPTIVQPLAGTLFGGGDSIFYSAGAADYFGTSLSPSAFTWSGEFHHDGVTDTAFGPISGATSGTFQVPTAGPSTTNMFYRLNVVVTDTNGNQTATYTDLQPRLGSLSFSTVPAGLQVSYEGQTLNTPATLPAVSGYTRSLSVPTPQTLAGSNYNFVFWSDEGDLSHNFTVPAGATNYYAGFLQPTLSLANNDPSSISLQWPSWAAPFSVWTTTNLSSPIIWASVTNPVVNSNGLPTVILPFDTDNRFFRLQLH